MNISNEVVQPNLFPFPFPIHLIFSCFALFLFIVLFTRYKKPYQLIMAFAIPFSLVIWISDNRTFFYFVGVVELVSIVAAFVSSIIFKKNKPENTVAETAAESLSEDETDSKKESDTDISEETESDMQNAQAAEEKEE